jgi:hypothetical protein
MTESEIKIYGLIKFGKKEHIQEFRNNGLLYMNTLATFTQLESDMARGDCFEGSTTIIQPKDAEIVFDASKIGFGKFTVNPLELTGPVRIALNSTASCNIFSMFAITKPTDEKLVDSKNLQFGDSCVLILNPAEFMKRVFQAAKADSLSPTCAPVEYYDANEFSGETGRFRKRSIFAYQNEYRIVVEPGSDTPIKLFVGSLIDITSDIIPLSEVNQRLDLSTRSAREAGLLL